MEMPRLLRPSARTQAILLLALVGTLGLLGGVLLERSLLTLDPATGRSDPTAGAGVDPGAPPAANPRAATPRSASPRRVRRLSELLSRPASDEEITRLVNRLAEAVELDEEQTLVLDSLLKRQSDRLREISREARGRYREVVRETRSEIGDLLTDEQRRRLRLLLREGTPDRR